MCLRILHVVVSALFLSVLFINAISPYIGLKWEHSFNMFANLRTDASNHLIMPRTDFFGMVDEYYYVDVVEDPHNQLNDPALRVFSDLINIGQRGNAESDPVLPINGNVVRYQIDRLSRQGVELTLQLRHFQTGRSIDIKTPTGDAQWTDHSYLNQYPIVRTNYERIHMIAKRYHRDIRDEP